MNRRVWTGILAGVLAATVLLGVAGSAYRVGERHQVVTRAVGDGDVVRVVDGYGYTRGHGPGFLFPLLGIVLIVWLVRGRRGPWSGRGGWDDGTARCGPQASFEERHRQAHGEPAVPAPPGEPTRPAGR